MNSNTEHVTTVELGRAEVANELLALATVLGFVETSEMTSIRLAFLESKTVTIEERRTAIDQYQARGEVVADADPTPKSRLALAILVLPFYFLHAEPDMVVMAREALSEAILISEQLAAGIADDLTRLQNSLF